MFKRAFLGKFEWTLPEDVSGVFVENLIFETQDENFVVVKSGDRFFFTNAFNVLSTDGWYNKPLKISVTKASGGVLEFREIDFEFFKPLSFATPDMRNAVVYYSDLIKRINEAISAHVDCAQIVMTLPYRNDEERQSLETRFKNFTGIKLYKVKDRLGSEQFEARVIEAQNTVQVLENLKRELERDCFARIGIFVDTDKTHQLNTDVRNTEQGIDLINSYELKLREDFCARANRKFNVNWSVKIHEITPENTISRRGTIEGAEND